MYVGVDVHKKVCRAAMANDEGELVDEFSFRNAKSGIEEFMMKLEAFRERVLVAVESTGNLWIRLYDVLEERGIQVVLSNPYKTRLIAEARVKTDKVNAKILAQLLRVDMLPLCFVPTQLQRDRRQFIRHRVHLVKMRTEVMNRIHALLDKHGLRSPFKTMFSKKGVEWLRSLKLGFTDDAVLRSDLALLDVLDGQVGFMEAKIAALAQAAHTARLHDERFRGFYERYARRKGDKKAVVAVAHEMLRIVYFMLKRNEPYRGGRGELSERKLKMLGMKSLIGLQA